MKKIIIFSTDVYTDLSSDEKINFKNIIQKFRDKGNIIIFTSRDNRKEALLDGINVYNNNYFIIRDKLKNMIKEKLENSNYFVVVGNREADLFMAASNKLFYIVPKWCENIEGKVKNYGIKVGNLVALQKLIDIIENQNSWFYRLDLDKQTTILSLTSANTKGLHSNEELDMINGFRAYLKSGNKKYSTVLLCHFLASISNNIEFREIKDWSIMPSSGVDLNRDMILFKEKARELMNGRKKENIFIRHTATWKSHEAWKNGGDRMPCDRHFETIKLNNYYKGKLKGRTVCVFDDYLTKGTTFETARNLLKKEKVKKIFFVSLGKFGREYLHQNYELQGDLYNKNYKYKLINREYQQGIFNQIAVEEIENLHDIIFN